MIGSVGPFTVPGFYKIDLARSADVGYGIQRRFDIWILLRAWRQFWFCLVRHLPRPEVGPTYPANFYIVAVGLQCGLSDKAENTPRTSLAGACKHGFLYINARRPDIDQLF